MGRKILIAEDDKFLAAAYRAKFDGIGWEVKLASDGKEALEVLKTFTPDVVITDLMMPNLDGFGLLTELQASPKTKNIPVMVMSNLGQKEDKDKALNLGAKLFLIKSDSPISQVVEEAQKLAGP